MSSLKRIAQYSLSSIKSLSSAGLVFISLSLVASPVNTNSYTENDGEIQISHDTSVYDGTSYDGGSVTFDITNSTLSDFLKLSDDGAASSTLGVLSVVGTSIYIGNGSSADIVGSVDTTNNGQDGKPLTINFTNNFDNAEYQIGNDGDTDILGWTTVLQQIRLGIDQIAGQLTPVDPTYPASVPNQDQNIPSSLGSLTVALDSSEIKAGSIGSSARLTSQGMTTLSGYDVVRGPAIYSNSTVKVSAGDTISFDWQAKGGGDAYDVFGYIIDVNNDTVQVLLNQTGSGTGSTGWQTTSETIDVAGEYRFVFIAGTFDESGGKAAGAQLFMDTYVISQANPPQTVTADNIRALVSKIKFENNNDNIDDTTRNISITAVDAIGANDTTSATIAITAVNDAPSYTGNVSFSVLEGTSSVTSFTSSDLESHTVSYSLSGTDAGAFNIDANSGALTFKQAPSFGIPLDNNRDNSYEFVLTLTDSGSPAESQQTNIVVNVTQGTDSDGDGVPDTIENAAGTNVNDQREYPDSDGDGVPDYFDDDGFMDDDSGNGINNYFIDYPLPFQCDGDYYISRSKVLFRLDSTTTPFTFNDISPNEFTGRIHMNAFGFNYQDGFIYGLAKKSNKTHLYRAEASGLLRDMGQLSGVPFTNNGDFDLEGNLYVTSGRYLYKIDVDNKTHVRTKISTSPGVADIAFNVRDGHLYGAKNNLLYKLDIGTKAVTKVRVAGLPNGAYGSAWFDSRGRLFISANNTGDVYRIDDLSVPVANYVSKGEPTNQNDGAACSGAPLLEQVIVPASTTPDSIVTHTYTIDNSLIVGDVFGDPLTFDFVDELSDGRTFVAGSLQIDGANNSPTENSYAGTNTLTLGNLEISPSSTVTIKIDVQIPANLEGTYFNQAKLTGIPSYLNGPELLSDNPGGSRPDPSPLVVIGLNNDNIYSGHVYNDLNKNGTKDGGEPGVAGVKITLNNGVEASTDINGDYVFDGLTDGSYTAVMTLPSGYQQVSPLTLNPVAVSGGTEFSGNDFSVFLKSSITGIVFEDTNGNGIRNDGESLLSGVTVKLFNKQKAQIGSAYTTEEDGEFYFGNLDAGLYWLEQTDLSSHTSVTSNLISVNLAGGQQVEQNFADIKKGIISGTVFNDLNGNGRQDNGEDGLVGVAIDLHGDSSLTTATDDNGQYEFVVAAGSYSVEQTDLADYISVSQNKRPISINNASSATINFADMEKWTISGFVYHDQNGNSNQESSELGLAGIKVALSNGDETTTKDDGSYQFKGANASTYVGQYTVSIETKDPYVASANIINQNIYVPNGGSAAASFALLEKGSVLGKVFYDLNGNGLLESNEPGVAGVLVSLSNGDDIEYFRTNNEGNFEFVNIASGDYQISQTTPDGYVAVGLSQNNIEVKNNSALVQHFALQPAGVISGKVFYDVNGNGEKDPQELGLAGIEVSLTGDATDAQTTPIDGSYTFIALTDGNYQITQAVLNGFDITTSPHPVTVLDPATAPKVADIANRPTATISGIVFDDKNGNGKQDNNEVGIGGVSVDLTGATSDSTVTSNDGRFLFTGINNGVHNLSHVLLTDYISINGLYTEITVTGGVSKAHAFADQLPVKPIAVADRYRINVGTELIVNADNGVLSNDSDQNNDSLTAVKVSDPAYGVLQLNSDGSFIYTVTDVSMVTDTFSYQVSDGDLLSDVTTVTIVNSVSDVCYQEDFIGAGYGLDPSWTVLQSKNFTPEVVNINGSKRLRLTESVDWQGSGVTKDFPIPTNGVTQLEFTAYAYGGDGADGISVILSDWDVAPVIGGAGGSLSYANRGDISGFAGGWMGLAIDEWGNFSRSSESKWGGIGRTTNSVAIRGSGSDTTGYKYLTGTKSLTPTINGNSSGHAYRVTIDTTESGKAFVTVERDVSGGSNYKVIIDQFDVLSDADQAQLPAQLRLSLAASTGGRNNTHELGGLLVKGSHCDNVMKVTVNNTPANMSWNKAEFTIELSEPAPAGGITVDYTTLDGDALEVSEYVLTNSSLTFLEGEKSKVVTVPLQALQAEDDGKSFYLQLSNPTNAYIGAATSSATLEFVDSDGDDIPDGQETDEGTDPNNPDTDGDGTPDGEEKDAGTDPLIPNLPGSDGLVCNADVYQSRGDKLFRVNTSNLPFVYEQLGPTGPGIKVNAIGFNYNDGFIYGMSKEADKGNHLIRIDSKGRFTDLGAIANLPNTSFARGDFSVTGEFYLTQGNTLYQVNVDTLAVTETYSVNANKGIDIAFNPVDGHVYSSDGKVMRVTDLSTETSKDIKITGMPADAGSFGSHWFDSTGNFYMSANKSEDVYRIVNPGSEPVAEYIGRGIHQGSPYDAAACVASPRLTHTISAAGLTESGGVVTHSYEISNGLPNGLTLGFADSLSDGRTFVADSLVIEGTNGGELANAYADTNNLILSDLSISLKGKVTIRIDVNVPALTAGRYLNQAKLTGVPVGLGGNIDQELMSDYPQSFQYPDATPMEVTGINNQLSGYVFYDLNGNGTKDDGEPGLRGVKVKLNDNDLVLTDINGFYQYDYIANADDHELVVEKLSDGFIANSPETVSNISLKDGESQTVSFAYMQGNGVVNGSVFNDINNDGLQGINENAIAQVSVTLKDKNGTPLANVDTDSAGHYQFDGLLPGLYWLEVTQPNGYFTLNSAKRAVNIVSLQESKSHFTFVKASTVSGTVFNDFNGDKIQNPDEVGLSGVQVDLFRYDGTHIATQYTATDGRYEFSGLVADAYYVIEQDPTDYTSITANTITFALPASAAKIASFADQQVATVSGVAFVDANVNGIQDDNELGLPGISITLSNDDTSMNLVTDTKGRYQFTDVVSASYKVTSEQLTEYLTISSTNISVLPGQAGNANFAYQEPGQIAGRLFNDSDLNGTWQRGETGIANVRIGLGNGTEVVYAYTNNLGEYSFEGLVPGEYTLSFTTPDGYLSKTNQQTLQLGVSDSKLQDFPLNVAGVISGYVVNDVNGNLTKDLHETGLAGVTVSISGLGNTQTNANGFYLFNFVADGDYTVSATDVSGFMSLDSGSVEVSVAGNTVSADFYDQQVGTISGSVVDDFNGNGQQEKSEGGLTGVEVTLSKPSGQSKVTTLSTGEFLFVGLPTGDYELTQTDLEGYVSTSNNIMPVTLGVGEAANHQFFDKLLVAPIGTADEYQVAEGELLTVVTSNSVLVNDTDENGDNLTATLVSGVTSGTLSFNADGTFTYQHDGSETRSDSFTYIANDGDEDSQIITVTITVTPVNDIPVALDQRVELDEDSSVLITLEGTDEDGDSLTYTLLSQTKNGTLQGTGNSWRYTPKANFNGNDSFTFRVNDGQVNSNVATVELVINPVNDPAIISGDITGTSSGTLIVEDIDVGEEVFVKQQDTKGDYGEFTLAEDGTWTYVLDESHEDIVALGEGETITDEFVVVTADGTLGKVTITITGSNDLPNAVDDHVTTPEDTPIAIRVLDNDVDLDGDDVSLVSIAVADGEGKIGADGVITYTPEPNFYGEVEFTYVVSDGTATVRATVYVDVTPVNDAPVATDDVAFTYENQAVQINHLANDTDIDSTELTTVEYSSEQGQVEVDAETGAIMFTPNDGFVGIAYISYTISDGELTDQANIEVVVNSDPTDAENLPPIANLDEFTLTNWDTVSLDVLINDTDPEDESLTIISAMTEAGEVSIVNGQLSYTPTHGLVDFATIEYGIIDSQGLTAQTTVNIDFNIDDDLLLPNIEAPADLCGEFNVMADALYTKVDLGNATATDRFGNPIPVSVVDGVTLFPPGVNTVYWQATDSEGRTAIAAQKVCVVPLVSVTKDQSLLEGESGQVGFYLNGEAESYPVVIPYTVTGTAEEQDHTLASGEVVIEQGSQIMLNFDVLVDDLNEDAETIVVTLDPSLNRGAKFSHTVNIVTGNVAPQASLTVTQDAVNRLTVAKGDGEVTVTANVYDPNEGDTFSFNWSPVDDVLVNTSDDESVFSFDPEILESKVYRINLTVTDSAELAMSDHVEVYINVVDALEVLSSDDSDGDGIPDNIEGYADEDGDGLPDYLDRIDECNVLTEINSVQDGYLIEGNPGVCLRRGNFTLTSETGGAHLTEDDLVSERVAVTEDTEANNIGGIFDFIAYGLPENSQSVSIVLPQRNPVPENAVYRKYREDRGWIDFFEDNNNQLWSTKGEAGYCPPPQSDKWTPDLTPGDWCVQLVIEDGGVNDDDDEVNGTVIDPGFVGVKLTSNAPPVALNDAIDVDLNATVQLGIMSLVSDPDGDDLTITSAASNWGTTELLANNQVTYQAKHNYSGKDVVVYGVSDGNGGTATAQIEITIIPNLAPVLADLDVSEIQQGTELSNLNVLEGATDNENEVITVIEAEAENGQVTINPDGSVSYVPNEDFIGTEVVTFVVRDEYGHRVVGTFTVVVNPRIKLSSSTESGSMSLFLMFAVILMVFARRIKLNSKGYLVVFCLFTGNVMASDSTNIQDCDYQITENCKLFTGWYLGGSFAASFTDIDKDEINNKFNDLGVIATATGLDNDGLGWSTFAGYQFNPIWGLELGYLDLGKRSLEFDGETNNVADYYDAVRSVYPETGKGLVVTGTAAYPINDRWKVAGKVSLFNWSRDYETFQGDDEQADDDISGTDLILGLEANYAWRQNVQFYAEANTVELASQRVNSVGLGIRYLFDKPKPRPVIVEPKPEPIIEPKPEPLVVAVVEPEPLPLPPPVTIYFGIDLFNLDEQDMAILAQVEGILQQRSDLTINMVGQASTPGEEGWNMQLSNWRVHEVTKALLAKKINLNVINTEFVGDKPGENKTIGQRVDIEFVRKDHEVEQIAQTDIRFSLFSESLSSADVEEIELFVKNINLYKAKQITIHSFEKLPGDENGLKEMAARRIELIETKLRELGVTLPIYSNFVLETDEAAERKVEIRLYENIKK